MLNDSLSFIIAYENGDLPHDEVIDSFQNLVDTGLAWQLQEHYGRMARRLLENGEISL